MTTLLWIRHGETDWIGARLAGRMPGIHLNKTGMRQAEEIARMLDPIPLDAFFSSPLERAMETAQPSACAAGKPIVVMESLQEVDFGELAGLTFDELREVALWKQVHYQPSTVKYPGGESLPEVQQRAVAAVGEIFTRYPHGVVALFTHSDTIRLVLCHFLKMPLDAYPGLVIDPASVSILLQTERAQKILGINLPPGSPLVVRPE